MARDHVVVGLDIGTSTVYTVLGQKRDDMSTPKVLGVGVSVSSGMRRGVIVDSGEIITSIRESIQKAERSSGIEINRVYAGVGGGHVECMPSRGAVAVSRADQEISPEDITRVLNAAQAVSLPPNRELLDIIAKEYIVDKEGGINNAVGMHGVRLEVETILVGASTPHVKMLRQCIAEAGVEVAQLIPNAFASARSVLTKRQKELGVVCLDIGGGTTGLTVYEEGELLHTVVLPVGSMHITNDLAIGLRSSVEVAEHVKKEYGLALAREASKRDTVDLSAFDPNESGSVLRKDIANIVEARLVEIFDLANKELRKISKEAFLPAGVVLVGGGSKIPHIVDLCKECMRLPAQIGFPHEIDGVVESVDEPAFATALGLVFHGFDMEEAKGGSRHGFSPVNNTVEKMQKWMRAFLP